MTRLEWAKTKHDGEPMGDGIFRQRAATDADGHMMVSAIEPGDGWTGTLHMRVKMAGYPTAAAAQEATEQLAADLRAWLAARQAALARPAPVEADCSEDRCVREAGHPGPHWDAINRREWSTAETPEGRAS